MHGRQFDGADISMETRVREGLPAGSGFGAGYLSSGIAALGELESGSVIVRPDTVRVSGLTGNPDASTKIAQLLVEKLGQDADFSVDVTYEERLDPIAALPTPEECLQQIGTVTRNRKITFDPGSADIAGAAQVVMDDIAEILRRCPDLRVEVAGYTDSQGPRGDEPPPEPGPRRCRPARPSRAAGSGQLIQRRRLWRSRPDCR